MVSLMRVMACLAVMAVFTASGAVEAGLSSPDVGTSTRLDDAQRLVGEGKYNEAIPVLEEIAASAPESAPQALKLIGDCYKAQQNWTKAIEIFEKLLADYPNSAAPDREVKAWIIDCHLANGDLERCLSLRKELLSQYQDDAWKLYYIVGRRHVWSHEYSKAIPELKQAVSLAAAFVEDPDVADASYRLLHCYVLEKQWEHAENLGPQFIKSYPSVAYKFYMEMGKCYQGEGKYDQAIERLETAGKLVPKEDYYNLKIIQKALLDCYDRTARSDEATSLANKLAEDHPDELAWKWELGRRYMERGDYVKAVPLFEKVIESSNRRWEIRSSQIFLGECMSNLGKGDEALKNIESYYRDKPELWDEQLLAKAGLLFYGLKDNEGCVAALEELLAQVAPDRKSDLVPTARELMYKALEKMEKWAEAGSILEVMAMQSNSASLMYRAAKDYLQGGKFDEAKRTYKAVLEDKRISDDRRADCMYGIVQCYMETGLKNAARRLAVKISEEYPSSEAAAKARGLINLWSQSDQGPSPENSD